MGFKMILSGVGVKTDRLLRRSPNLNPFADRRTRAAKELRIDQMIFFGEDLLRRAFSDAKPSTIRNVHSRALETRSSYPTRKNWREGESSTAAADWAEC